MNRGAVSPEEKDGLSGTAASEHFLYQRRSNSSNSKYPFVADSMHHDYRNPLVLSWVIRWIDGVVVVLTTFIAAWIGKDLLTRQQEIAQAVPYVAAVLVYFLTSQTPRPPTRFGQELFLRQLRFVAPSLILACLVQVGVFWWLGWTERALLQASCAWALAVIAGLIATRVFIAYALNHPTIEKRFARVIAVIGHDEYAFRIAERLGAESQNGVNVVGIFDDVPQLPDQTSVHGSIDDLISLSREINLNGIIIALPPALGCEKQVSYMNWRLRSVLADLFIMPYLIHDPDVWLPVQSIGSMSFMVLRRRPLDEWQTICKTVVDVTISLVALIVFFPLALVVVAAIKIDSPGPVLFRQPRRGFNNRQFTVFKFRSMHTSASDLMSVRQTSRDDPRVTRVGKGLRKLSIDELPQLLNVLRGEMSLVGPRPHAPQTRVEGKILDEVNEEYAMRYNVKPGITGWAQVNGARGELVKQEDLRRRVAYDLEYIQHWSIWFDLKIMALTVTREIISKHAF